MTCFINECKSKGNTKRKIGKFHDMNICYKRSKREKVDKNILS